MEPSRTETPRSSWSPFDFIFRVYFPLERSEREKRNPFFVRSGKRSTVCFALLPFVLNQQNIHSEFHWSRNDWLESETINDILCRSQQIFYHIFVELNSRVWPNPPLLPSFRILVRLSNQSALHLALFCACNLEVHTRIFCFRVS